MRLSSNLMWLNTPHQNCSHPWHWAPGTSREAPRCRCGPGRTSWSSASSRSEPWTDPWTRWNPSCLWSPSGDGLVKTESTTAKRQTCRGNGFSWWGWDQKPPLERIHPAWRSWSCRCPGWRLEENMKPGQNICIMWCFWTKRFSKNFVFFPLSCLLYCLNAFCSSGHIWGQNYFIYFY